MRRQNLGRATKAAENSGSYMSKTELTSMECPSCGGQTLVAPDGISAKCRYCGGTQILQHHTSQVDRLKDLPNASLDIRHREPTISLDMVRTKIIEEFGRDPIGLRDPETLDFKVAGGYLPVWFVETTVKCSWYGKYSETRTVTNYRTVTKTRNVTKRRSGGKPYSSRESYTEQEPYSTKETVWHPFNGTHDFLAHFQMAATGDFALENFILPRAVVPAKTQSGFPVAPPNHTVHSASFTQREAWEDHGCLKLISEQAHRECAIHAEQLDKVAPKVERVDFTLVYLPFAVVTYSANSREYRHLFDLADGSFMGDQVALDHTSVEAEAIKAEAHSADASQKEIDKTILDAKAEITRQHAQIFSPVAVWGSAFFLPGFLLLLSVNSRGNVLWVLFYLTLILLTIKYVMVELKAASEAEAMKQGIESSFPREKPWRSFITERRRDLLRLRRIDCDRTIMAVQLAPDAAIKHTIQMQRLRQLEEGEPELAWQEAERIACSLYENPRFGALAARASTAGLQASGEGTALGLENLWVGPSVWSPVPLLPSTSAGKTPSTSAGKPPGSIGWLIVWTMFYIFPGFIYYNLRSWPWQRLGNTN